MKVALIPARGGSKRIPRKNILPFAGRPMIEWSIAAAHASGEFDHVIVSTDDEEIGQVARLAQAEVPFVRPASLSGDHTGTTEVVAHAAIWMQDQGWDVDAICCIYATAPFLRASRISAGYALLRSGDWDYVFCAGRFSSPVQRSFLKSDDSGVALLFPEHRLTRSQDLPSVFHDAGQFYWGGAQAWREQRPIFAGRSTFLEESPWRIQDIDTPDDWQKAEYLFDALTRSEHE